MGMKKIREKILTDDNFAMAAEYMLSNAISKGISLTVKFIYKHHKIIKNKRKFYSIYDMNGRKLYSNIRYQDLAKYIIDNKDDYKKISYILNLEQELQRMKEKIEFEKELYSISKNKDILEPKISRAYMYYNMYKKEFMRIIGKKSIC